MNMGLEAESSIHDKQLSVPVKKTVLRDVQNDNKIAVPSSAASSSPSKDKIPNTVPRVSGIKRALSECQTIPSEQQPPSSSSGNGPLVYVRRKSEADAVRNSNDNASIIAGGQVSRKLSNQEARTGPISQTKEPTVKSANGNGNINADGQVSRKLSNQEASTGPISQKKEPTIQSANDNGKINADCELSGIISHHIGRI